MATAKAGVWLTNGHTGNKVAAGASHRQSAATTNGLEISYGPGIWKGLTSGSGQV